MMKNKQGFTLIEMILAMSFIAFLLLVVALTTISMGRTYQRGVMLSNVNAAGRVMLTDLQRTMSEAPVADSAPGSTPFSTATMATGGALCLGTYSYVWNNGSDIATGSASLIKYQPGGANGGQPVRLAKLLDYPKAMCNPSLTTVPNTATELLPSQGSSSTSYNGLALQKTGAGGSTPALVATIILHDTTQAIYQVSFTLSTNDTNSLDTTQANAPSCVPQGNLDYCAVNSFIFYVRAGGGQYNA